jgi:hypothetical protein
MQPHCGSYLIVQAETDGRKFPSTNITAALTFLSVQKLVLSPPMLLPALKVYQNPEEVNDHAFPPSLCLDSRLCEFVRA